MKTKTSISIDQQVCIKLKNLATERNTNISSVLQKAIDGELLSNFDDSIMKYSTKRRSDSDFDPVEPKQKVSELVRRMRDERENSISGQ